MHGHTKNHAPTEHPRDPTKSPHHIPLDFVYDPVFISPEPVLTPPDPVFISPEPVLTPPDSGAAGRLVEWWLK